MTRDEMWLLEEKFGGMPSADFERDCERLKRGEPLAYVIGHIPFLNTTIYLDSHPLIPRPETEFWTSNAIELMKEKNTLRVLDLCAGSGCIGVSILKELPHAKVDFGEIEEKHHGTILKNIEANDIDSARGHIFGGDLFQNIENYYDAIVTNPPYIDPMIDRAEASVKIYEPHTALYGGRNGFELISRIIHEAHSHLAPRGLLIIEHEPEQVALIEETASRLGYTARAEQDQYETFRYTVLTREDQENMST